MNWLRKLTLVAGLFVLLTLPAYESHSQVPTLSGTFIQFQKHMMKLKARDWDRELSAMKTLGVNRIVLQWTKYDDQRFYPVFPLARDAVKSILRAAERYDIQVYLGLYYDSRWWTSWNTETFRSETIERSAKLAQRLAHQYADSPAFAGWYLPFEVSDGDFGAEARAQLHDFFAALSRDAKAASDKPVLASTFFKAEMAPDDAEPVFRGIFQNSGVDVLLVQDGVGANNWKDDIETTVVPYLEMFRHLTRKLGMKMWVIPEVFAEREAPVTAEVGASSAAEGGSGTSSEGGSATQAPQEQVPAKPTEKERVPADSQLVLKQMQQEQRFGDLVAFDLFHYASPFRSEAARKLYDELLTINGGNRSPQQKSPAESTEIPQP